MIIIKFNTLLLCILISIYVISLDAKPNSDFKLQFTKSQLNELENEWRFNEILKDYDENFQQHQKQDKSQEIFTKSQLNEMKNALRNEILRDYDENLQQHQQQEKSQEIFQTSNEESMITTTDKVEKSQEIFAKSQLNEMDNELRFNEIPKDYDENIQQHQQQKILNEIFQTSNEESMITTTDKVEKSQEIFAKSQLNEMDNDLRFNEIPKDYDENIQQHQQQEKSQEMFQTINEESMITTTDKVEKSQEIFAKSQLNKMDNALRFNEVLKDYDEILQKHQQQKNPKKYFKQEMKKNR